MASETKWMTVMLEVDTYDGEVQSIRAVDTETADFFSKEELEAVLKFLREDDDADYDIGWSLQARIREAIK